MARIIRVVILLAVVTTIGYFLGVGQEQSVINVYGPNGELISSQTSNQTSLNPFVGLDPQKIPWYVSRSSAIAAYLLLFATVFWGLGMTIGFVYSFIDPARAWQLHKDMGISFGVLVIIHAFSLLLDRFMNFSLIDILVPFVSQFKPIYLSLGIIAAYLLIIIMVASIFYRLKSPRFWRFSHYLTFALFVLALIHGLNIGTDSGTVVMQVVYIVTGSLITALSLYRLIFARRARLLKS